MARMLEVSDLRAGYGMFAVLHGVSFHVDEGEVVAIVGSNGAGKTTSMRCISGLLAPGGGRIAFRGESTGGMETHELVRAGLVSVPEGRQLFPELSVLDNLLVGAANPRARKVRSRTLDTVLELFPNLEGRRKQACGTLSGGEQQMVAIGRGLMALPALLLLDEPSLGLAPRVVKTLFDTVRAIRKTGVSVLLVEQNVRTVLQVSDRGYVIEHGRTVMEGKASDLVADPQVVDSYFGAAAKERLS